MNITAKNILGLRVETKNGNNLGKITNFELDTESHDVRSYSVESGFLEKKKLLVSRNQVVSINNKKMIVEDSVVKEEILEKELSTQRRETAEPALSASTSKK